MFNLKPSMHEDVFWRTRLSVAFRTAFGCILAGLVLQLGTMHVQWATFPIFAYVMATTVVGESTFGKALQDTAGILIGTIQGIGMAMLVLQIVGAQRITLSIAIVCTSLSSFVIVYPQKTRIISKRVALAHSAILYITASVNKESMDTIQFPLKLAGTTMVGAISGMFAVLLPFPHLAMFQVQSQVKLSTRIVAERLRILVDAFCVNDVIKGLSLSLQARSLGKIGSTVDSEIISKESDLGWEFPGFSKHLKNLMKGLKSLKNDLVGMELALTSDLSSTSSRLLHHTLKDCLVHLTDWACLALRYTTENGHKSSHHMQLIIDEGREALSSFSEKLSTARQKLAFLIHQDIRQSLHDGSSAKNTDHQSEEFFDSKKSFRFSSEALFFLFNLEKFIEETEEILLITDQMRFKIAGKVEGGNYVQVCDVIKSHLPHVLHDHGNLQLKIDNPKTCKYCDNSSNLSYEEVQQKKSRTSWCYGDLKSSIMKNVHTPQLLTAFKMSLAMGMGAFLGSWFDKRKGYWADITLGLGFTGIAKGGSFKVATLRAQGTVAGSIYGLLVVLATKNFPFLRLLALIPWVILTSFLRQSKLYGFAGAVSAFTGAIVILARTTKDSSDEAFVVIRIVEAFVGMASFIIVEVLIMPRRAASIVKNELISGLGKLRSHMGDALSVFSESRCEKCCTLAVSDLKLREKSIRSLLARLKELIKEATEEPQFWYSAFPTDAYTKIMEAQRRMVDLLQFSVSAFDTVLRVLKSADVHTNDLHNVFGTAVHALEGVLPLLEFLEQALQSNTLDGVIVKGPFCKSDKKPFHDMESFAESKKLISTANTAHHSAFSGRSLLRVGSIKTNCFMEDFENGYHVLMGGLFHQCSDAIREQHMEQFSNSVLLSLGTLAFSLEGLLREACELEKGVHELLQLESPWSVIDLWGSSGPPL